MKYQLEINPLRDGGAEYTFRANGLILGYMSSKDDTVPADWTTRVAFMESTCLFLRKAGFEVQITDRRGQPFDFGPEEPAKTPFQLFMEETDTDLRYWSTYSADPSILEEQFKDWNDNHRDGKYLFIDYLTEDR
jgi:hypothetical protein